MMCAHRCQHHPCGSVRRASGWVLTAFSGQPSQWRSGNWQRAITDEYRLSVALRMAANTLWESNSYLGAQFRRLKRRLHAPVAIQAMAAKLARLIYRMLRYGMQFVDQGAEVYEETRRHREIQYLKQKAASLGFQVIDAAAS